MKTSSLVASALLAIAAPALAVPAPSPAPTAAPKLDSIENRDLVSLLSGLKGAASSDVAELVSAVSAAEGTASVLTDLKKVTATTTYTAESAAFSSLSSIVNIAKPSNYIEYAALLVAEGLTSSSVIEAIEGVLEGFGTEDSSTNTGHASPKDSVYPKSSCDAPYSVSESALREAIYIPSSFTYGEKPPVVLFPGTGSTGYISFIGNFIKLLTDVDYADPVWVNVPGFLLQDAQVNAEYAAYAINYIAALTERNVSTVAWSQGNIDVQWAFKYWPSTREVNSNHIAISPDYKGTVLADFISVTELTNDPSVVQQFYYSDFITTLRRDNGDSAYIPTTVMYSGFFDEIVEPQQGTNASAYLLDSRGVGVTNNEVQLICPGQPAGSFYTHEGMMANPLSFALAKDALVNGGPGQVSRIDLDTVCAQYLATGLDIEDFLLTENSALVALIALVVYPTKVVSEPTISAYATASRSTCTTSSSTTSSKSSTTSHNSSTSSSTKKSSSSSSTKKSSSTSSSMKTSASSSVKASSTSKA